MVLIQPLLRNGSFESSAPTEPCGGSIPGLSHTLTLPGATIFVQWRTVVPSDDATCLLRLGNGKFIIINF